MVRVLGQKPPADHGAVGRTGKHFRPIGFNHVAAIGLLLKRDTDHIHFAAQPEHIAGHGQGRAPLARARFRRQRLDPFLLGIKCLRHGRVRFM